MKKIILAVLGTISLIFSSCTSTYYYSTLNTTNNDIVKVENGDFLFENDSLWIAYCFKGEDAPIQITVFNKLDAPLFVNWQQSSLILNGVAYPYSDGRITYTETSMNLPPNVSLIPPKTMVSHRTLRLAARFDEIKNKKYATGKMLTTQNERVDIRRIAYNQENTPLSFGSYLTIYSKPENIQAYRTDFYVNNLIKTKVKPNHLPAEMAERGDTFYQQKRPDNRGWEVLAVSALAVGAVAIDVWTSNDRCYDCNEY